MLLSATRSKANRENNQFEDASGDSCPASSRGNPPVGSEFAEGVRAAKLVAGLEAALRFQVLLKPGHACPNRPHGDPLHSRHGLVVHAAGELPSHSLDLGRELGVIRHDLRPARRRRPGSARRCGPRCRSPQGRKAPNPLGWFPWPQARLGGLGCNPYGCTYLLGSRISVIYPDRRPLQGAVAYSWYKSGMARVRISTTVDELLLASARRARSGLADAALIDEALDALLARNRAVEIDASYAAYDTYPLDSPDQWGDLASFRKAAGAS